MNATISLERKPAFFPVLVATLIAYTAGQVVNVLFVVLALVFASLGLKKTVRVIAGFWAKTLFLMIGKKVKLTGRENIQKGRNYIFVANHGSFMDIPAMMLVRQDVAWLGNASYFRIPFFGRLIRMMGFIPVETGDLSSLMDSFMGAIESAQANTSIGFFPEGTRTLDGRIGKFRSGFVTLLRNCDLDVLPMTFNGFYSLKPKTSFLVNPEPQLEIVIHKPISNEMLKSQTNEEILKGIRKIVESAYVVPSPAFATSK